jgi:hypothetical protein
MTAELESAEADVVEPLNESAAKRLDSRIRLMVKAIQDNVDKLYGLVQQAKQGQIHITLGFDSWTAYLAEVVHVQPSSIEGRRALVALLSGEGMSQRGIASVVGVSKKTVQNDQEQVDTKYPPAADEPAGHLCLPDVGNTTSKPEATPLGPVRTNVIGLDGKSYRRKPKEHEQRPRSKTPPLNVADDFTTDLSKIGDRIDKLSRKLEALRHDDRYPIYHDGSKSESVTPSCWSSNCARHIYPRISGTGSLTP